MTTGLKGIDRKRVSAWLTEHVADSQPPFDFELIAAGGSNLTYRVTDAAGAAHVLRRPPVTGRIATAHDMAREYRIIAALGGHDTGVPVPRAIACCSDEEITGAPFYVMGFVDGLVLRDSASAAGMSRADCDAATESLVDVQVAFHTLDLDAVGLADLGKHTGYVARQLKRWRRQAQASKTRALPLLYELHGRLERNIPMERAAPGLAHGDYRFDNTIVGPDYRVTAVLDWELCTIGDPVADFCWSLMYWADPDDDLTFLPDPPTRGGAFVRRDEVAALYQRRTGFDLSDLDYYTAFSWWKMACIVEGVYARMRQGATGGMETGPLEQVAAMVDGYLERAHALAPH